MKDAARAYALGSTKSTSHYLLGLKKGVKLYLKSKGKSVFVQFDFFLDHQSFEALSSVKLPHKKMRLYRKMKHFYELEVSIVRHVKISEGFRYTLKVERLLLPKNERKESRFLVGDDIALGRITVSTVAEQKSEIIKSRAFKEQLKKLRLELASRFDFVGIYPADSIKPPTEIFFCMHTGTILYFRNFTNYNLFFQKNSDYFAANPDLKEHLLFRIKTLKMRYKSLLVRPIEYLSLVGEQFPVAYAVVAQEKSEIMNDDILFLDQSAHNFYTRMTAELLHNEQYRGRLVNFSINGACFCLKSEEAARQMCDSGSLRLVFRIMGYADIEVAGKVVYCYAKKNGYYLGFSFQFSKFGERLPRFLYDVIQSKNFKAV